MIEVPDEVIAKVLHVMEDTDTLLNKLNAKVDWLYNEIYTHQQRIRTVKHELEEKAKTKKKSLKIRPLSGKIEL